MIQKNNQKQNKRARMKTTRTLVYTHSTQKKLDLMVWQEGHVEDRLKCTGEVMTQKESGVNWQRIEEEHR